ncbi:cell division protein ZapA [Psychroflexus sp. MES1-P1E]|jgi:cell division protein ZapA (FtsZ GTPase activity inhibitor)|uniref:cell division protein ZapA n=1 Tax=Psychroflexus sp. MES1-P1E TaxID=2058320 RepID=UPI000C79F9A3|nr:cell division protein ZapA [Psychroflexus sp. MES1-P1E]PKG43005.1 cell division protein ZapA [Psychroflexus sp. MES1-P1E]
MGDKLKIKLSIADRVYPLNIRPEQEEGLRKAAKRINVVIKKFEQDYAVRDKQDVLAMSALQFAAEIEQNQLSSTSELQEAETKLVELSEMIKDQLN